MADPQWRDCLTFFLVLLVGLFDTGNGQAPVFNQMQYNASVSEAAIIGSFVTTVKAVSPSGETVLYYVDPDSSIRHFGVQSATGVVVTNAELDRETNAFYSFLIRATDESGRTSTTTIHVTVTDVNDNSPSFLIDFVRFRRNESSALQSVGFVKATDNDEPGNPNSIVTYEIGNDPDAAWFQLDRTSGELRNSRPLDYERQQNFTFFVLARDSAKQSRIGTATITIQIMDVLESLTSENAYSVSIPETTPVGDVILNVTLMNDTSPNATFHLIDNEGKFNINATTGEIFTTSLLYWTGKDVYNMSLYVEEEGQFGQRGDLVPVSVTVLRNQGRVTFPNTTASVSVTADTAPGTTIFDANATDSDTQAPFNVIRYSLVGSPEAETYFSIDPVTGRVTVQKLLTNETSTSFTLRVQAEDGGGVAGSRATLLLTVQVQHNLHSPRFLNHSYSATLREDLPMASSVLQVLASDADVRDPYNTLVFTLTGSANTTEFFTLDADDGLLTIKKDLRQTSQNFFNGTVQVCDAATPPRCESSQATLSLDVIRNLGAPQFLSAPYNISMDTLQVGTTIANVTATDPDNSTSPFGLITYSIIGDDEAPAIFQVDSSTGAIRVRSSPTLESSRLRIRVQACDGGNKCNTTVITVNLRTNFLAPEFSSLPANYQRTVPETITLGDVILDLNATDRDPTAPSNVVSFAITEGPEDQACFQINSVTGELFAKRSLLVDPCTANIFNMIVTASDGGSPSLSATASVTVFVQRNQNPPVFQNEPYQAQIDENTAVNTLVATVTATDADLVAPMNTVSYSITGEGTAPTFFSINKINNNNAEIRLQSSVLSDSRTSYTLQVRAFDGGSPPKEDVTIVIISVNRNLFPPEIFPLEYNVTILESQLLGLEIIRVNGSDRDSKAPHNVLRYEPTGNALAQEYFNIQADTGAVYIQKDLRADTAKTTLYLLSVGVRDQGTPVRVSTQTALVRINVLRNSNCPRFQNLPANITINQTTTGIIYTATATDSDSGVFGSVEYSISGDDNAPSLFTIFRTSGQVQVQNAVAGDTGNVYRVRVQATDFGSPVCSVQEVLTVNVLRNLFSPVFDSVNYNVTILETHPLSSSISTLTARDQDSGEAGTVRYEVAPSSQSQNLFYVEPVTGQVFLRSSLVGVTGDPYVLTVLARDNGLPSRSATQTLTVRVLRNSFPPEFVNEPYQVSINRTRPVSSLVFQVSARDNDTTDPYNRVRFRIFGDDDAPAIFTINDVSGQISLQTAVPDNSITTYRIRVLAEDGGTPVRTDTAVVTVTVNRNQNDPVFVTLNSAQTILETQTAGLSVVKVSATDADTQAPFNEVRYEILGNDTVREFFQVDAVTGDISLRRSMLDYPGKSTPQVFQFQVTARDNTIAPRQAPQPASVTITVIRNTAPFFVNSPYTTSLQENATAGSSVFQTSGRDNDRNASFNSLSYSLLGDGAASTLFQVDSNGLITVRANASLTTDRSATYTVRVAVVDGGSPPLSAVTTVTVNMIRNFHAPRFLHGSIVQQIPEGTAVGTLIADANATDDDVVAPLNEVTYQMVSGNSQADQYMFVNPTTGAIILLKSVAPQETISRFLFSIEARDGGSPSRTGQVSVDVTVLRTQGQLAFDAPNYNVTISENRPVGDVITTVRAQPGTSINYTVTGLSSGPSYFSVNSVNGQVTIRTDLRNDASRITSYQLVVVAERIDISRQTATATVNIQVIRNEFGPQFGQLLYNVTISDTTSLGTEVVTVSASDRDNDTVEYRMMSGPPSTEVVFLNPRTGVIFLAQVIRGNNVSRYQFLVQASDQRSPPKTQNATVIVNVIHDLAPPRFINLPSTVTVREDTANGTSIFIVSAQDSDLKGQLVFGVSGVGVAQAYFTLMTTGTSSSNPRSANVMLVDSPAFRNAPQSAYQLRVTVYDSAYPETVAESFLNINAERNLNSPIFGLGPYQKTINESQPLGVSLVQVQATDGDGDSLLYSIIGDARAREFYYIDPLTGIISLKKSMTEGTQTTDIIQIQARDQRAPERFGSTTATITIIRDTFPPQFQNLPYITSLNIGRPNGSDVLTARATDADLKGIIIYEVTGIFPAQVFFAVDSTSGMVRLIRPLSEDGQNLNQYLLRLIAYDSVYPNQRATATATISVNRNPSAPACQPPNLSLDIAETLPIGSIVADANATDADGDPLTYRMVSGDPEDIQFFFVYPSDGRVALNRRLTDSNTANFVFEVDASDGSRTCITTLALRVVRDAPPVFVSEPYSTQFVETRPVGDSVYTVRATDPDIKGQIIYNAVGRYQATRFFSVNNTTGSVQIIQNLKMDILNSYELVVTAYDSGSPGKTATATVFISVTRNPNPPALGLPSYSATLEELIPVSSSIVNVTATDPDGDTLRYEFVGTPLTNKALQFFSINADDGRVVLTRRLTEDTDVRYIMTVRVRDQRTPEQSALGTVTVNVLRNQQPPVFQNLPYNQQLSENTLASSSVYAVRAVDPDLRGSIMYEAVGDDQATYFFRIHPSTGNITLVNSLRTDRSLTYTLRIQAYDSAYPLDRATATVLFTIRRNENSPVWITSPYRVTINETTAVGTSILRINASDLDTGDVVRYVSVGETDTLDLFWLNPDTGDISVIRPLKPGTKSSYRMVVEARDSGYPTRTATVEVFMTILRDQGPPVFQNLPYISTQNEFITTGSFIQDVVARDPDLKGQIVYQLDGIYPAPTFFSLDNSTGRISLASSLKNDPERKNQYLLRLLAWDSAVPDMRTTATATVNVVRNPSPPTWGLPEYRATIPENHPVLAPVVNVSATDTDPGDVIRYALLQETAQRDLNAGPADYFFIDTTTGAISLRKSVLGTAIVSFRLLVQACDSGVPQRCISTNVTITVDRSGQFPVFDNLQYTGTINETAVLSQSILTVRATDPDLKGQIVYELETATQYFALDRTTGVIYLARSVQNDLASSYPFNVVAYDSLDVPRSATAQVTIIIIRNLNGPVFLESPYQTTISEYHRVGSSVINTTAVDIDGDTVRYSIVSTDQGITNRFFINPQNGIIYLSQSLENTQVVRFDLTVQASDQRAVNAKVANVQVTILVDLDEYPRFSLNPYTTTIPETYNVSSRVMTITATDGDLQGQITYMTDGIFPSERLFSLNTASGEITLTRGLMTSDALNLNEYRMNVIAYDSAYPQRRATSTVIITVTRNPNAPQFQAPSYDVTVSETRAVGSSVVNVTAVDQDGDPVTYAITADTSGLQNYFYLDPRNGRVIITSDLTKTPQDIYIATVTASDSRGRIASVSLTIRITRITDRPPFFVNTPYRRDLLVSQPINTVIYTVTAQDSDLQGRLLYAAVGLYPALNFFSIDSTTGQISLTNNLRQDNLSSVQYTIRVEAFDTAFPNTRASENVFIVVNRNPNRPVFDRASYIVTIPETQAVGSSILGMNATDEDGDTVQYYIQNDALEVAANNYFFISAFTGIVYVKQDLTTTNQNRFQFTGLAYDNGVPQNSAPISVIINIERDGGRPQFTQTVYTAQIPETTPVNDTLPVITVTANDADRKGTIRYVATGDRLALAYFWIDQNGRIYVRTPLLGVVTSRFDMTVEAYDDQYPNNRGSSLVVITVIRNPNTPTFGQSQYNASVFEYDPAGTMVVNTTATDRDGDSVRYSLQDSAEVATYFYIDDRTGGVYLRQPVSPNPSNQYSFSVEANDQRSPAKVGRATVLVTVQRDQLPRLTNLPDFISLNEDTAASTSVFTVTAQDSNLRGALRYELVGDGVSPNFFQINNVTGVISTSAGLSQDINRNYVVRVVVYDTAIPGARVTGVLTVTVNRNANAPQCQQSPYMVSVDEGTSIGTLVLNVSATDADIGDTLRYEMINQGDAANYFFVDGSTGRVYLTRSVSGIQSNQFQFQVQARDRIGQPALQRTANCDVRVTITRDTSLPVFVGLPYIVSPAVLETVAINSAVFSGVRATDADLRGSIVYEATGIYPATSFFGVDRNTGVVWVIQNLRNDGLALDTYRLEVIAYDSASPDARATATVTISVVHNPSIPTFHLQSFAISIDETTTVGRSVINASASDADGDTITYSITPDNNFFYIDPRTGVIYLRQSLIGTTDDSFTMTATAQDNGRPSRSSQANVVISVKRVAAPVFSLGQYSATVAEDQPLDFNITRVSATKSGAAVSIRYEVVGDYPAPTFFRVSDATGDISIRTALTTDVQSSSSYTLRVAAYDSQYPTVRSTAEVLITVTRNNPNSVIVQLQENSDPSSWSQPLNLSQSASANCSIQGDQKAQEYFQISANTCVLSLRKNLTEDADKTQAYRIAIAVTEGGTTTTKLVIVNVPRVVSAPSFTNLPGNVTLPESLSAAASVFQVSATDSGSGATLRYELVGDGSAPTYFNINASSGLISTTSAPLRQDISRNYIVRVVVYDTATPSIRATGTVVVDVNRNANAPQCQQSPYVVSVDEGANIGTLVLNVSATDADSGETLQYALLPQGNAGDYFFVDGGTGRVYLTRSVRGIQDSQFQFQVQARDRIGQPSLQRTANCDVNVTITKDTSLPAFVGLPYIVSPAVLETVAINSTVFSGVRATDADLKGSILYEATGIYPATSFFGVDRNTGVVRVIQNLKSDGLALDTYRLEVIAYDSAKPDTRATATVTISVVHNPSIPTFRSQSYVASIDETTNVGLSIIQVNASDADGDTITYSITGDNNNGQSFNFFYIDPRTAVVYLRQSLVGTTINRFDMTVTAVDNGRPSRSNQANLVINVNRIQAPGFVGTPYQTTVREDQTVGTSFFSVRASKTNPTGTIMYRVIGLGSAQYFFTVNNVTGDLLVLQNLRQGIESQYTLRVQAYDSAYPTFTSEADIVINMIRNPNSPVLNGPYTTQVGGQATAGTVVININATDLDGDRISYQLEGDTRCKEVFYIEVDTGIVRVNRDMNSVADIRFDCTVQASDNARPTPKTTTSPLTITVVRQNLPVFTSSPYRATVNESDRIGLPVVRVTANKSPEVGTIVYEIVGVSPAPSFFRLDNQTGEIFIAANLSSDPLKTSLYTVRVVAYDLQNPDLRSTADALITVNRNQTGPVFVSGSTSIQLPEQTDPSFWSQILTIVDPNNGVVTCSIISDQKAQEYFQVDPRTCVISLRKNLTTDPDLTTTYKITVQATDDGQPAKSSTSLIEVNVPRDRFAPSISNLPAAINVEENAQTGTSVFNVIASDQDRRGNLVYNLIGEFPASLFFQINNATGEITVRLPPNTDSSGRDSYTGIVEVYDSAWPNNRVQGRLTINVRRNPNAPVFINSPYSQSIPDTRAPGSLILTVTATDADQDRVRYTLSGINADYFYVEPDTGRIILTRSLLGGPTQFQLQVVASDSRTPAKTASAPVTIVVNQVQSNPYFVGAPYTVTVPISRPIGSQVTVVEARDSDLGGQITYGLIGISTAPTYFSLNNATGEVTIQRPLTGNTDTNPRYVLLIQAYDSADPNNVATTTLTVIVDRNENGPVFNQPSYSATINDYDPKGLSVVTVLATDRDLTAPENQVLYSLDSGRAGVDYFTIDPYSGLISIKERVSADLARPASYQLLVSAKDPSSNPKSATATVNISVNRNMAPVFDNRIRSSEVSAGVPVFTTIIEVTARDPDSPTSLNGQLVYSIVSTEANRVFQVNPDTGAISARVDLQNAVNASYTFTVMANDKGIPSLSDNATVSISIKTIQDPYFQPTEFDRQLQEDTAVNATVINMTAVEPVLGTTLSYEIRGDDNAPEYFTINSMTGEVRVAKILSLDTNKPAVYMIRVHAVRRSDPTRYGVAFVRVRVIRNLRAPRFLHGNLTFSLLEDQPVGQVFGRVNATDEDQGQDGVITYLVDPSRSTPVQASNFFYIKPGTGQLTVSTSFAQDSSNDYNLAVSACDGGSPSKCESLTVTILVIRNQYAPNFVNAPYSGVLNSLQAGSVVFTVSASDNDFPTPRFGEVRYALIGDGTAPGAFVVNQTSGVVSLGSNVSSADGSEFRVRVQACDLGGRCASTVALVTTVQNFEAPIWVSSSYDTEVLESQPLRQPLLNLTAIDRDPIAPHNVLEYSLRESAGNPGCLGIEEGTGQVFALRSLAASPCLSDVFRLEAVATDKGTPRRTAEPDTKVVVTVLRNRHAPVFQNATYRKIVSSSLAVESPVFAVTAIDADTTRPFQLVSYRALGDQTAVEFFRLNASTGQITVNKSLATAQVQEFRLAVEARDGGIPPRMDVTTVYIQLESNSTNPGSTDRQPDYSYLPILLPLIVMIIILLVVIALVAYLCLRKKPPGRYMTPTTEGRRHSMPIYGLQQSYGYDPTAPPASEFSS